MLKVAWYSSTQYVCTSVIAQKGAFFTVALCLASAHATGITQKGVFVYSTQFVCASAFAQKGRLHGTVAFSLSAIQCYFAQFTPKEKKNYDKFSNSAAIVHYISIL